MTYDLIHAKVAMEKQRTRVLRRMESDVDMLNSALVALSRQPALIHVVKDHMERVRDSLNTEIKELRL